VDKGFRAIEACYSVHECAEGPLRQALQYYAQLHSVDLTIVPHFIFGISGLTQAIMQYLAPREYFGMHNRPRKKRKLNL